ncbi:MAG: hypothetical protein EPO30_01725 [Lysobacteraceae bacterium]|nr:MAG: hypothetical protein EPO30_01725 [Xanthomonadaceae bacterium]
MMRLKSLLRRQALALLGSAPVIGARMSLVKSRGMLTVLNLHRVGDDRASAYEALSPRLFEEMLRWLVRHYTITTFKELQYERSWRKPPMVLSFDDGYRDFIEVVAPILDKHGLGANQNIIPACVDSGRPPVTVIFQDFIGAAPAGLLREIAFPGLDARVDPDHRIRDAMRVSAALKARPIEWQKAALLALEPHMQRFSGFRPSAMMGVTEVRQVVASFEVGAHSFEHATMAAESEEYLQSDFERCTNWFGRVLGARPEIYAFPNGMATWRQCQAASHAGYPVVLLVGEQFSRPDNWCHHRFTFHAKSMAEARFRAAGAFSIPRDQESA